MDKSGEGSKEVVTAMRERYPNLGNTVYIEMTGDSHSAVLEIPGRRLNWIWYVNQPEPTFKVYGCIEMDVLSELVPIHGLF